ncbi:MAG: hypothetical protein ACRDHW_04775 [Ktedonobacteraceae bacterium]
MAITIETITRTHQPLTEILSRRATYKGIQYVVFDQFSTEIVTVRNGCIGCTCGFQSQPGCITCSHITLALAQEQAYSDEASKRADYSAVFGIE